MPAAATLVLFLSASLPLVLAAWPAVAFVPATSVRSGRRAALPAVAGVGPATWCGRRAGPEDGGAGVRTVLAAVTLTARRAGG